MDRGAHLEAQLRICSGMQRERRLRAGWRLLVFLVIVFLVAAVDGRVRAGLGGAPP